MKVCRNEIATILGVSLEGLKKIEKRKQLKERLINIGYEFIDKTKEKRNVYYEIKIVDESKQCVNNICKHVFEVDKPKEFTIYLKERTEYSKKDLPATLDYLSNKSNVSISTVCKWDLKLLDKKIISNDGFFYFKLNKNNYTIEEVSKEEFASYWRNKSKLRLRSRLHEQFSNGEISFDDALDIAENAAALKAEIEGKYLYRTKRYKLNEDNLLYTDIIKLI